MAEPREIAGMVESSMGAGGQMMPEEDSLDIELEDNVEPMPEGVELIGDEEVEVEAEEYDHTANLAEVLDDGVLGELSSDLRAKFREDVESIEDWEKYYRGIKIGSERVFEWAKSRGCHSIVAASTAAVYGDNEEVPFNETTAPDPMSPYAEYKLEMESVLDEYHNSTTQCAALRFFNVFGEGQPNDVGYVSAIPIFKKQFETYQPITVTGDGLQTRDFVYVGDVVDACFTAITRPNGGFESMPIWNVASGEETQILDIAESFGGEIVHIEAREEPKRSLADISLITQMLDWRPTTNVLTWIKEQKDA